MILKHQVLARNTLIPNEIQELALEHIQQEMMSILMWIRNLYPREEIVMAGV